ncbi:MAG TPA: GGDEF domain-containing protein [Gemmatimonadaceae bacterium]|nr:GGDEF domain-containing protein [Gemmatimonadaceae bacterium]
MSLPTALLFPSGHLTLPPAIRAWLESSEAPLLVAATEDELMSAALRALPLCIVLDGRSSADVLPACVRLKADAFSSIAPALVLVPDDDAAVAAALRAGADEVLRESCTDAEMVLRLDAMRRRAERDRQVQPTTLLPGPPMIEREIRNRLGAGAQFAVCYADLDHFKEYNDRYSFAEGDRVIRMVARILHDVVLGFCGESGFVGHIGGDDYIFIIPPAFMREVCDEVIAVFDALTPLQYSSHDSRAGYYFGKDRRGQLHRVPLMTISIGVVTNERRHFIDPGQVSELATEMKSYAKTRPGSVYVVDRRQDGVPETEPVLETQSTSGIDKP